MKSELTQLPGLLRTHNCGELRETDCGQTVVLSGWVNKSRDLGGLHFMDLRDKYGITQLAFDQFKGDIKILKEVALESVISIKGLVRSRPKEALNAQMETGQIEVSVTEIKILSPAVKEGMPFFPYGQVDANEDTKLKYRYLDLRTKKLQQILALRSEVCQKIRQTLSSMGFVEVETPILYKSTPEGARDYIVPSRVQPGKVYALPQSPQTLKQLLMIGGTDRYFQITKCFRDEDLRAERQPEFTQVDLEASFVTSQSIKKVAERVIQKLFDLPEDFTLPVMTYAQAMNDYGVDKPDVRFGLKHLLVTDIFKSSEFKTFSEVANTPGGLIKSIFVSEELGSLGRKEIDGLIDIVKPYGGKGVAWFKHSPDGLSGGISKFIDRPTLDKLNALYTEGKAQNGIWLFFADASPAVAHASAGAVRNHLGRHLNLIGAENKFLWVNDFPLLEWSPDSKRYVACHHPFTMPRADQLEFFLEGKGDLGQLIADAYDVVCNGHEIAGGSMRIYDPKVQKRMFEVLGMNEEEVKKQFGFFIEALQYGTPPHGGAAFGLDRLMMLLAKTENIRDVIAFPKTASASDLMAGCPSVPSPEQMKELGLGWLRP